jgi:threonine dehydrogenase-like Zn-dependent dehydrogenase
MCARHAIYGFKRRTPGAMAPYMIYPAEALVHQVSGDLPAAHAAFAEPLSCALHAVQRAGITFGDVVVVAGCGPIGLGMVAGAAAKSPASVLPRPLSDAVRSSGSVQHDRHQEGVCHGHQRGGA